MERDLIQKTLLEVIRTYTKLEWSSENGTILEMAKQKLGPKNAQDQRDILSGLHDLYRIGHIAPGANLANENSPKFHVTRLGMQAIAALERDPTNVGGYLEALPQTHPVVHSYVEEACRAYAAGCYKASAVTLGGASEFMGFQMRESLVARLSKANEPVPKKLKEEQNIRAVLGHVDNTLRGMKKEIPKDLFERFDDNWSAFSNQVRRLRNDAGHPKSIEPVDQKSVLSALIMFPILVELNSDLIVWIRT